MSATSNGETVNIITLLPDLTVIGALKACLAASGETELLISGAQSDGMGALTRRQTAQRHCLQYESAFGTLLLESFGSKPIASPATSPITSNRTARLLTLRKPHQTIESVLRF